MKHCCVKKIQLLLRSIYFSKDPGSIYSLKRKIWATNTIWYLGPPFYQWNVTLKHYTNPVLLMFHLVVTVTVSNYQPFMPLKIALCLLTKRMVWEKKNSVFTYSVAHFIQYFLSLSSKWNPVIRLEICHLILYFLIPPCSHNS